MRVLSIVCLALVLPQLAGAQDTDAPDGEPPPAPPAEVTPPEPAPAPEPAAPPPANDPPQAQPAPVQAPPQYQPPQYQPPKYRPQPYPPPSYGYPPPRAITVAPPPSSYTPQPSPLLSQPWPSYQPPAAPPAPSTTYYYYPPPSYPPPVYTTPPVTMPPLPPGYAYVPSPLPPLPNTQLSAPGDSAGRDRLYARLHQIDTRLDALRVERVSIGGPVVAMVLGFGSMAVAGAIGIIAADNAHQIKTGNYSSRGYYDGNLDFNNDGQVDRGDRRDWVRTARVGAGVAGAGFLIGILGAVGLRRAVAERSANAEEQRKLRAEHVAIRRQLDYGPIVGQSQYGLQMRGRF